MLGLIVAMAFSGLIIGALGRLLVPGPNPMGIFHTILVGLAGSFLGGLVGRYIFRWRYGYSWGFAFLLAVVFTAAIVYFLSRRRPGASI